MHGQTHGPVPFWDSQAHINKHTLKHIWAGESLRIRSYRSAKEPVRPDQSSRQPMEGHSGFQSIFCLFFERCLAGIEQGCRNGSALTAVKVWQAHTHTHTVHVSDCDKHSTHPLPAFSGTIVCVCVFMYGSSPLKCKSSGTWSLQCQPHEIFQATVPNCPSHKHTP